MTFPSPTDRFAIIPVTHGPAPDDAIVVGPISKVMEYIPQSVARNDAHEELEKARFTADQIASLQNKTRPACPEAYGFVVRGRANRHHVTDARKSGDPAALL